jgi:hypothetical protein
MRLKIMHAICLEEKTVGEIVAATAATQTNVSRHLNRMHAAGARRTAQGLATRSTYRVADPTLVEMCRDVCVRIAAEIDLQQPLRRDLLQLIPDPPKRETRASGTNAGMPERTPRPGRRKGAGDTIFPTPTSGRPARVPVLKQGIGSGGTRRGARNRAAAGGCPARPAKTGDPRSCPRTRRRSASRSPRRGYGSPSVHERTCSAASRRA